MDDRINEPAYSKSVIEFITVANDFCIFMDSIEKTDTKQIVNYLSKVSPLLYLKASLLPEVVVDDESVNEKFVTHEQYQDLFNVLREKFGKNDTYWVIDLGSAFENSPIKASISENFTDVYQDLKDFVLLYQKSGRSSKQCAVRDCAKMFKTHWGICLLNAEKAMHHLMYKDFSVEESPVA
jgi:Domain of unknown function (DUF5063)